WLLRWLSLKPKVEWMATAESTIIDWIEYNGSTTCPRIWETYSASERVVNWLLYFAATAKYNALSDSTKKTITGSLLVHLRFIVGNLEYQHYSCNNHILNNARALYIGGQLLGLPQASELGRLLFCRHLPEMVDEEGFLQEGSSHYQLLLIRTLLEILWVAQQTGDTEFKVVIEPVIIAMLDCCRRFFHQGASENACHFLRIGDVSPDFPIYWFIPLPSIKNQNGSWWELWDDQIEKILFSSSEHSSLVERKEGCLKILENSKNMTRVFISNPLTNETYPAPHGHLDFGSFSYYDHEGAVVVDRGRYSYTQDGVGQYGYSARAHNTTVINGLPILPASRGIFIGYKDFIQKRSAFRIDYFAGRAKWSSRAIERLGGDIEWQRDLMLEADGLSVSEKLSSLHGKILFVESYLHFAPEWTVTAVQPAALESHSFDLVTEKRAYRIVITCDDAHIVPNWLVGTETGEDGWHFPEYGEKEKALTLKLSLTTTSNFTIQWELKRQ
ncbi:heparinase II/III family protein, partial [Thermodesulfobacteriota bacterium]